MAGSITASNAQLIITIPGVFAAPQPLQAFAADDVFDTSDVPPTESVMGVDGHLAAGVVFVPTVQNIALQASSPSVDIFDAWAAAMKNLGDVIFAQGIVLLTSVGKEYTMRNGTLTNYKQMPDARRLLQARRFQITWEKVEQGRVAF